jgi:hypothetical protein
MTARPGAATTLELELVRQAKEALDAEGDAPFQEFCVTLFETEFPPSLAWPWILQKVYLPSTIY